MITHRCVGRRQEPAMSSAQEERTQERESERAEPKTKTHVAFLDRPGRHRDRDSVQPKYFIILENLLVLIY